ncbi:hypothetical protein Cgig2_027942 [Carnegiea gigantea]|uniref:NPH3 domain-containing protein n=1 Tax=Carnegiea gigantea TaxID=171969 RepID=A0A9Q1GTE8_9CARY|nr:hypothetical protein Cgig2_027942 [Carnegiea gigantea]
MEALTTKECSVLFSPYSSPNLSALLKIKIISRSQETGLPVTVSVRVAEKSFNLHKVKWAVFNAIFLRWVHMKFKFFLSNSCVTIFKNTTLLQSPLVVRSGYFKRQLSEWQELDLPGSFPGGSETFEMIVLFIYGSSTFIDPFNVASLRCAAEFLEMTEAYGSGNLCERTDLYLTRVVLQNWDDTLIVLQKCQSLLPWSEQLLIVSRCIESLAFMACMEILDPERKQGHPLVSLEALTAQPWSTLAMKEVVASQDLWIKDLIALPFPFFKRVVRSLRRQGMKEKYVSPIILFYANKWVLSKKTRRFWECLCDQNGDDSHNSDTSKNKMVELLQGILDLLPDGEKARRVIPVGFYLAMLGRFLELGGGGTSDTAKARLQDKIVALLPLAHVEDFLLPKKETESMGSSVEVSVMDCIFSSYFSSTMEGEQSPATGNTIVAELWDMYLSRLACDRSMEPRRFMSLVDKLPLSYRISHDHLYRAMSTYLKTHPDLSQDEKASVCKYLNCQRLSQEVCAEAVQDEFMPLRLIVQALFVQQLNTQQAFRECSESFRFAYSGELSGSLSSSRNPTSKSQNLGESPFIERASEMANKPLGCFQEKDALKPEIPKNEYESTSFRIHNLEQELLSLEKSLQSQKRLVAKGKDQAGLTAPQSVRSFGMEGRSFSKRRHALGQVTGCIGSVNFVSHRKYAGRLLKIFRRITLLGRGKLRKQSNVSAS